MENNNLSMYKTINPLKCPCCNKIIYISLQNGITMISTEEDMEKAKQKIKEEVLKINFKNESDKIKTIEVIESEDFLRDMSDIEPTIKQIQLEQLNNK